MPRKVFQDGWRQGYEQTKWPFRPEAALQATDGSSLDEGMFLDAMIHPPGTTKGLHISSITIQVSRVTISFGDESGLKCSATFSRNDPPSSIPVTDIYDRPAGILVADAAKLTVFQSWNVGSYSFTRQSAELVAAVVSPSPANGVSGILVEDTVLSGDVWIVGGHGVILEHQQVTETRPSGEHTYEQITVNMVGSPLYNRALCDRNEDGEFEFRKFIQRLCVYNGGRYYCMDPGSDGGIVISPGKLLNYQPALRIHSSNDGLKFELAGH